MVSNCGAFNVTILNIGFMLPKKDLKSPLGTTIYIVSHSKDIL